MKARPSLVISGSASETRSAPGNFGESESRQSRFAAVRTRSVLIRGSADQRGPCMVTHCMVKPASSKIPDTSRGDMPSTARPAAAVSTTLVRIRPEIGPRNFLHRRIRLRCTPALPRVTFNGETC